MPRKKLFVLLALLVIGIVFLAPYVEAVVALHDPLNVGSFTNLINRITSRIRVVIGGLAVIALTIAGIYFLTSGGKPERMQLAKRYLTYAIIGIAIALLAETIRDIILEILRP